MPQEQFHRVKQNQDPSPESSEKFEPPQSQLAQETMRSKIRRMKMEKSFGEQGSLMEAEAEHRRGEGKETSRAKSIWHEENNQIATVLNSIHQFTIQAHRLDRSRSAQEINNNVSDGFRKNRENQRSERLQQIRS